MKFLLFLVVTCEKNQVGPRHIRPLPRENELWCILSVFSSHLLFLSTHRHQRYTPVLQLSNKLVSIPVLVVDAGPHLDSQWTVQHLHHPPNNPLKPSVSAHQSRSSPLPHQVYFKLQRYSLDIGIHKKWFRLPQTKLYFEHKFCNGCTEKF